MNHKENDEIPDMLKPSQQKTVAIVDDEPDIVELVTINLKKNGYRVKGFYDATSFIKYVKTDKPDLLLLDLMLPDVDGYEVCKYLRKDEKLQGLPIIMLTARAEESDKVIGLELGADDYITKPFSSRELIARVRAVLRRDTVAPQAQNLLKIGSRIEIDLLKYDTRVDGEKVELTSTEFKILTLLAEHSGWVYSREQILDRLGSQEKGVLDRTVDVHIKNLREKLGLAGKIIRNIRGVGYKLEDTE